MIRGNCPLLTLSERAVATCMAQGMKPKQIMGALDMSRHTFERRHKTVKDKLGAMNDTQVGVLLERHQLVPVDARNVIEDRREERLDARRAGVQ